MTDNITAYELQPPGLTTFFLLAQPCTGGDTLFTSQVSTLKKLSPQFVAFLKTLKAVHSGVEQAEFSKKGRRGGIVRRDPVENVHPVVRKHPVTGAEALYVNKQFTRRVVGLKCEESGMYSLPLLIMYVERPENILKFLYDHIDKAGDLQARVKWEPGTVVLWDNRITAHVCIHCFTFPYRKLQRITACSPQSLIMGSRANVAMAQELPHRQRGPFQRLKILNLSSTLDLVWCL